MAFDQWGTGNLRERLVSVGWIKVPLGLHYSGSSLKSEMVQHSDHLINSEHPLSHFEDIIPSNYFFSSLSIWNEKQKNKA